MGDMSLPSEKTNVCQVIMAKVHIDRFIYSLQIDRVENASDEQRSCILSVSSRVSRQLNEVCKTAMTRMEVRDMDKLNGRLLTIYKC